MCTQHEKNAFQAFVKCKCPHCHSGKLFTHSFYNLSKFLKYNQNCPVCGIKFEKETGFFWSAMYISYGINVAISVTVGVFIGLFFPLASTNVYIISIIGIVLLFSPLIFRYSRIIALYAFGGISYNTSFDTKKSK